MAISKNDEFIMDITDMGSEGEGIGRYEGMAFFVKGAVIGDRVKVGATKLKKTYGYARLIEIITPSPARTSAPCPVAARCGGCQLQMMRYEDQLRYKQDKVKNDLIRLGGIEESRMLRSDDSADASEAVIFHDIIGMETPAHYRNKAQYPVGCDREGRIVSGFYAGHTHSIIDTEHCMIQHELADRLIGAVKRYMAAARISAYDETTGRGLVRHVLTRVGYTTHEVMVCIVINGKKLPQTEQLMKALTAAVDEYNKSVSEQLTAACAPAYVLSSVSFNVNTADTNVIMGDELHVIAGQGYITDYIGDVRYRISPLSFYQVNPVQTRKLYSTALKYAGLNGGEVVWDLYCGIGTISLFLAQQAGRVYGVEIVPQAIEDARANATLNEITNAEFFVGAAEEVLPAKYAEDPSMHADVIVVDPPRKGCDEALLRCITDMAPKRIVYVSCDPATLSRDVKLLESLGYKLKEVQPVDMFPFTGHVETVVRLG